MPKYKISIAEMDINVSTDETPEMVDTLVGIIDRRIREIISKSPRCSKSEAAILCALDYCAERIKGENKNRDMEHDYIQQSKALEALKKDYEELSAEAEKLRHENAVMSEILAKATGAPAAEDAAPAEDAPATEEAAPNEPEQLSLDIPVEEGADETPAATDVMFEGEHEAADKKPARKSTRRSPRSKSAGTGKNKVGDMFDMLTFKDV
ncbi:MAG: cell division protein ZapA [Clostridia bacterium]|nr:cell division protein ZapA [Clostridia bacterium]